MAQGARCDTSSQLLPLRITEQQPNKPQLDSPRKAAIRQEPPASLHKGRPTVDQQMLIKVTSDRNKHRLDFARASKTARIKTQSWQSRDVCIASVQNVSVRKVVVPLRLACLPQRTPKPYTNPKPQACFVRTPSLPAYLIPTLNLPYTYH